MTKQNNPELEQLDKELSDVLERETPDLHGADLLRDIFDGLKQQTDKLAEFKDALIGYTEKSQAKMSEGNKQTGDKLEGLGVKLGELIGVLEETQKLIPERLESAIKSLESAERVVKVKNLEDIKFPEQKEVVIPDSVKINNLNDIKFPEPKAFPKEIEVSNLKDLPQPIVNVPKEVEVKKPSWFQQFSIKELVKGVKGALEDVFSNQELKADLDRYRDANRPLAVRLSDGKKFINSLVAGVSGAVSAGFPFENPQGVATAAQVNTDGELSVLTKNQLVPEKYDEVIISYPDSNTELFTYKYDSSVVATVALTSVGGVLTNIVKS